MTSCSAVTSRCSRFTLALFTGLPAAGPWMLHPSKDRTAYGSPRFPRRSSMVQNASGVSLPISIVTWSQLTSGMFMPDRWGHFAMSVVVGALCNDIGSFGTAQAFFKFTMSSPCIDFTVKSTSRPFTVDVLLTELITNDFCLPRIPNICTSLSSTKDTSEPLSKSAYVSTHRGPFVTITGNIRR